MVLCTRRVPHIMAHNAHLAVIQVISLNYQRSHVMKMVFGSRTTIRAQVNCFPTLISYKHKFYPRQTISRYGLSQEDNETKSICYKTIFLFKFKSRSLQNILPVGCFMTGTVSQNDLND